MTAEDRLRGAAWLADAQVFFARLDGAQKRTRAVGGIVRDTVLGRAVPHIDIDMATELLPETVMERAQAAGISAYPTGIDHGTVTLVAGDVRAEVTTLRRDVETFGRKARVMFGTDWTADAARRDFTMNALYADADGTLYDPLGGLGDCLAGRVRFIGDPDERISEDRLRVYRFFRFSATHGGERLDPQGFAACGRAAGQLSQLSAERVGAEMTRLLAALRVSAVINAMAGIKVIDSHLVSERARVLFRAYETLDGRPVPEGRLALMIAAGTDVAVLQDAWRLSNSLVTTAEAVVAGAELAQERNWHELVYRYGDISGVALDVGAALDMWSAQETANARRFLETIVRRELPINGRDLMDEGFLPGPFLGAALDHAERLWIDSEFSLDKQALIERLRLLKDAE